MRMTSWHDKSEGVEPIYVRVGDLGKYAPTNPSTIQLSRTERSDGTMPSSWYLKRLTIAALLFSATLVQADDQRVSNIRGNRTFPLSQLHFSDDPPVITPTRITMRNRLEACSADYRTTSVKDRNTYPASGRSEMLFSLLSNPVASRPIGSPPPDSATFHL
jgi:hypothetical protein